MNTGGARSAEGVTGVPRPSIHNLSLPGCPRPILRPAIHLVIAQQLGNSIRGIACAPPA